MEQSLVFDIYGKLGEVIKEVTAIDKTRENKQQGFMFRGIEDVMNSLHESFAKHGIIILPREVDHIQDTYETVNREGRKTLQFRTRVHMAFKFVSTTDGSFVDTDGWGEAADNGDKGYNKCKSVALKYVLMQMFLIPTKDIADPDKDMPDPVTASSGAPQRYYKKERSEEPAPASSEFDLDLIKQLIKEAETADDLRKIWNDWAAARVVIKPFMSARKKELGIE